MQRYDLLVPQNLLEIQQWFAEIITQPLIGEDQIYPFTPRGNPIQQEASEYIAPSPTLSACQRIEIYNQQYWWRLVKHLQGIYPALTSFLGVDDFVSEVAVPYLQSHPPSSWELPKIGDLLPGWIEKNYSLSNRIFVRDLAAIENATTRAFYTSKRKNLDLADSSQGMEKILQLTLKLQPDVHLFHFDQDIFTFKKELLKHDVEYWQTNHFPLLAKEKAVYYYILYQNAEKQVSWKELSPLNFHMLEQFKKESSIEALCRWLETQEASLQSMAAEQLIPFIQECFSKCWLYPVDYC